MRIAVLVLEGAFDSGLSAVLDVVNTANALESRPDTAPYFDVVLTGQGERVRTSNGFLVDVIPWGTWEHEPNLVVMPATGVRTPEQVVHHVRSRENEATLGFVREAFEAGAELAAACTGTFFLAEAGVLDARSATTSWWLGSVFRERYPRVDLDEARSLLHDGGITTAGAAFAHIDLALSIVQRRSPALADLVGRHLLVGDRPSQAAFAVPALLATSDPTIAAFDRWVRLNLAGNSSVADAAKALGMSERTLQRACASSVGMSPLDFIQEVRLNEATYLLRSTDLSVDAIATRVGYQNTSTLRTLVRKRRGTSLAGLRGSHVEPAPAGRDHFARERS